MDKSAHISPDKLVSIPGTKIVKGKSQLAQAVLCPPESHSGMPVPAPKEVNNNKRNVLKGERELSTGSPSLCFLSVDDSLPQAPRVVASLP